MNLGQLTTGKNLFIVAITLAVSDPTSANEYYYPPVESISNISILSSKSIHYDYVEDKYRVENFNNEIEIITQAEFLELVSRFAQEQKELDPEFQGYLNEFELHAGKKIPSKSRL